MVRAPNLPDIPTVIADPDEYARRIAREVLRSAGIRRIHEASSAEALAQRLAALQPCMVLLDVDLNGLGSPAIAAAADSGEAGIVLTARHATSTLVDRSRRLPVYGLLLKPYRPSALWARLHLVARAMAADGHGVQRSMGQGRPTGRLAGDSGARPIA